MTTMFRGLLLLIGALIVVSYFSPDLFYPSLSDADFWTLLTWDGYQATVPPSNAWNVLYYFAPLAILVGLYLYVPIARVAFVVFLMLTTVLALFEGVRIGHPVDSFLATLIYLAYGAVLAISYLTSVSMKFARVSTNEKSPSGNR